MEKKQESRNSGIYVAAFLCTIAAVIDSIIGLTSHWPSYIYYIIWIQMAIIIVLAFDKKVSVRFQSFVFATFTFSTVFLSGLYVEDYYIEILMICGTVILASFYHDRALILYQFILSMVALLLHCTIFGILNLSDNMAEFSMAIFFLIATSGSQYINIVRDDMARENLSETARRAEHAERSKSDFLANMSHEIRTPMNAIIGMCELALRENDLSSRVREHCLQIQNSGRSLLSIINDVLDFSKIESGKMELVEEEFNLSSTLNDVINMTMTRMGNKNIEFIVRVDPEIPKGLIGDEIRIRQIMINILTNAVKYTREGAIILTVKKIVRSYGINLQVSVKDTGIGIKEENVEKLFSSFQQVDTKKNRAVEGTGLGLVITKRLLRAMGGFINVRSEYGKGSEFRFVIPLGVSDNKPFVTVNHAEEIRAACYIDIMKFTSPSIRKGYREFLSGIGDAVQIRNFVCNKFEDLKIRVERGNITHCFVGKKEFLEHKSFFESIADQVEIILVQDRRDSVIVPNNMHCLYKPIYEIPLASIFNQEESIVNTQDSKDALQTFIAPKAKVLIVDDNAVNLQVAAGLMQPYKLQVLTAASGPDAIAMLNTKDFDMVFMDHMMPEMDGVEATKIIRNNEDEYFKKVPIIALTANAVGGAREMFLQNGFNGFLAKPMELSALERALKQHLPQEYMIKAVEADLVENTADASNYIVSEEAKKVIHIETGLFYVGNSKDTYFSILDTYVRKGESILNELNELLQQQDWKNYTIQVHALKSSSLSIGAKELSELCKELESSGKAGDYDYIVDHHATMCELCEKVLFHGAKIIEDNVEQTEAISRPQIALQKNGFQALVKRIRFACAEFDGDDIMEAARDGMCCVYEGESLESCFKQVFDAADDFDYEKVDQILDTIVDTYNLGGDEA